MGLGHWIRKQPKLYREHGILKASRENRTELLMHALKRLDPIVTNGTPIYAKEWEVLIVLDACRLDVIRSVASQYSFLPNSISGERSLASCSRLWMDRNFKDDFSSEMSDTTVVTANPYSQNHMNKLHFAEIDEVWKYAWDADIGTVPCRPVTDRAIDVVRSQNPNRLIVHYLQPHFPSVPKPIGSGLDLEQFGEGWDSVWDRLLHKEIDYETAWNSYKANLEYVLDDVELLLENMQRDKIVITSDHGNAFGEWHQFGHPANIPIPILRQVPWIMTSGKDNNQYTPQTERAEEDLEQSDIKARLRDLGYV